MSQSLLELKAIKKYFPVKRGLLRNTVGFVTAVDGIDLSIREGENLGLVGESGCGKTTLAKIILRLINPDCGRIIFKGEDITQYPSGSLRDFRKNVQIVFQDPFSSLDPRFRIKEMVAEGSGLLEERDKFRILKRAEEMVYSVGLAESSLNRLPHEFSGGERQRIAIARALFTNPKLLVLDEAVSSLDVLIQNQILQLLLKLKKDFNLTYIFISHNLRVIKKVSQRIAVMFRGKIVELADTDEIFSNPLHPYTKLLLSAAINFKADAQYIEENPASPTQLKEVKPGHFVAGLL